MSIVCRIGIYGRGLYADPLVTVISRRLILGQEGVLKNLLIIIVFIDISFSSVYNIINCLVKITIKQDLNISTVF